jgi:hypothetical protein
MRTTWEIDDDVLAVVKDIASARRISAGEAASELLRKALMAPDVESLRSRIVVRSGVHMLPERDGAITTELVNRLRDEE